MIEILNYATTSPKQMEMVIEGMRNPMNSWAKSDSYTTRIEDAETLEAADYAFHLGEADEKLMLSLKKGGPVEAKYRRMMFVWVTINAPLYWWKEFDTYKVGTVSNSCSTMHKIHAKAFTMDDFSHDQIGPDLDYSEPYAVRYDDGRSKSAHEWLMDTVEALNWCREGYLNTKDKKYWWQMIQILPSSYNQRRTLCISYEALANMYRSRKGHKLDEWRDFCKWIETLPYANLIIND